MILINTDHFAINSVFAASIAFAITCSCIYLIRPLAIKLELVDHPGGRKHHQHSTPLIGGIAMFLGFIFACMTFSESIKEFRALFAATSVLIFIGVLDDLRELSPSTRLLAQCCAVSLMCLWGDVLLTNLGHFLPGYDQIRLGWLTIPFTLFAMLSLINAVNMSDGLDGLAGSITLVAFIFILLLSIHAGQFTHLKIIIPIIAVLIAFLCFNLPFFGRKHALLFMGDAGSLFIGSLLAWFTVSLTQQEHAIARPVTMLWLLAVPLFDLLTVFIRRMKKRRSPLQPGRDHLHHYLLALGLTPRATLLVVVAAAIIGGSIGSIGEYYQVSDYLMFYLFIFAYVIFLAGTSKIRTSHG